MPPSVQVKYSLQCRGARSIGNGIAEIYKAHVAALACGIGIALVIERLAGLFQMDVNGAGSRKEFDSN